MTTLFRAPWILIATALMLAFAPQGREGQKALVYCPVDVDASGCSAIVKALTDGGEFAGGVDRGYTGADGTVDLKSVDLSTYSVLVVPSLADDANEHPYSVLRDRDVAGRIRAALRGRQVFFSGTPDQGASIDSRAQKDALIRNLAHWTAARYASAKGPGIVVLQDQSEDVDARYAWARDLVGYRVAARTTPSTYSRVQTLTAAGREILADGGSPLSYANMASFGLFLPDGGPAVASDALGQGQGVNQDLIMVTMEAATFASTAADVRFAFLSPLGTGAADPLSFDATATPVVEICAWANNACSGALIARFTIAPTGANLPLTANAAAGRFEASWNLLNASFTTRKTYRIQVLQGTEQLGVVLVDVTRGRWALTRLDGSLAPLASANTLPVMFTMSPATTQNQAPRSTITAPATGTVVNAGQSIMFNGTGIDPEDGILPAASLVWTSDKAGQIGTGASFSTSSLTAGKHVITLKATDSQGLTGTATIDVIVNAPPVATITAPANGSSFGAGATINFIGTGTDADDGALANGSLVWTSDVAGPIGTGASINVGTLAVGSHIITLTATDSRGATHAASITISVVANRAPQASITAPATGTVVNAGDAITFTGAASDVEDGMLTGASLVWTSDKAGQIGTGATFSTGSLAAGKHVITLTATDSKGATGTATIDVSVNTLPVATINSPTNNASFPSGATITFSGTGTDAEDGSLSGASLVWTSEVGPLGTGPTISVNTLGTGNHTITLTVTDARGATGRASITIAVAANQKPGVNITSPSTPSTVINAGAVMSFVGNATDPEDGPLTGPSLVWTSDKSGQIGTSPTITATLPAGTHLITLTAADSKGLTNTAQVTVIVNALPVAAISAPTNGAGFAFGAAISFVGTGTDAEDGNLTGSSLAWSSDIGGSLGNGPSISVNTLVAGNHVITLTVTDSRGAKNAASITIAVAANQRPGVNITSPSTPSTVINAGAALSFAGNATDPEDGPLTGASLVWTSDKAGQIGTGVSITATLPAGTHLITLTATDSKGLTNTAQVTVIVNALPVAAITAPTNGASFPSGAAINFVGSGTDAEDGNLTGSSLAWSSDIGGSLGNGPSISVNTLAAGNHVITLTVTDSRGATHTASITVSVAANQRPNAAISTPTPNTVVTAGQPIQFNGTANDPEDGPIPPGSLVWTDDKSGQLGTGPSITATLSPGSHVVTLIATDSKGLAGTATVNVIVNVPPTASITSPLTGATFSDGQSITFSGTGSDAEDGTLGGASLVWTSETGSLGTGPTISVNTLGTGNHTITLTVTDARGATGHASITIVVAANQRPGVNITSPSTPSTVINVGAALSFAGNATDPEDGPLTGASLVWTSDQAGQLGIGPSITATLPAGTHHILLTATDSKGLTNTAQVTVIVNALPVAAITAPANGATFGNGATITFTGTGADQEDGPLSGNSLVWTSESGPLGTGTSIGVNTLAAGSHTITLRATDSRGASASASITITVAENQPPTVSITTPANNAIFQMGQPISFAGNGNDPEDGTLGNAALVWTSDRSGAFATGASVTAPLPAGAHRITLTATDSKGVTGTASINIIVNTPPVATITAPSNGATFTEGQAIDFTANVTDADEGTLTGASLAWTSDLAGALGTGDHISVTTLHAGTHHITLAANDHQGGAATAQITIVVTAPNQPPVVNITAPANGTVVAAGVSVTFTATAQDPEDGPLTGASVVWTNDVATQVGTGLSISAPVPQGSHVFTVTATDSKGLKTTATVTVIGNAPPTVSITSPANGATFQLGQPINFRGTGADVEDGQLTGSSLVWRDGTTQIGTGADITVSSLSVGPHTITLTATDSRNASAVATMSITVTANQAPVPTIAAPANGLIVNPGQSVTLTGSASDLEDGPLPGTALLWSSSQDGVLGTGASIVRTLSGGPHTITLKATDSQGAFATRTVDILVLRSTMSIPPTISVPLGTTVSMPIQIIDPAPAGGLVVSVSSDNPAVAAVLTPSVTIPAGQLTAGAQIQGAGPGTTTIRVSAPGYVPVSSQASVGGNLNIVEGSASFEADKTSQITVQLERSGTPFAAPPGGLQVALTPTNPSCVSVTSPVLIPAGLVNTTATLSYGGSAATPCNTTVTASAVGIPAVTTDNISVSVQTPLPRTITFLSTYITGAGLRLLNGNTRVTLGAPAPTGGLELTVSSSNGSVAGVAMNAASPGSGSIPGTVLSATSATVTIPAGQTIAYVAMDGMEGNPGTVTLTASAPGYTSGTAPLVVRPLALNLSNIGATTSLSPNTGMYAQLCYANPAGTDIEGCSLPIRPGGTPVPLTFTNSAAAVGQLTVVGGSTGQTVTATIGVGESITPQSGTGQVQFDPLGAGTTTVNVTSAGVISGVSATRAIPVSAPAITFLSTYITGAGLRLLNGNTRVTLGAPAPTGGLELTVSSSNGSVAGVAMNATSPGSGSIPGTVLSATSATVTIPAGQTIAYVAMDGMEGQAGTVTLTASAPGFTSGTAPLVVRPLALNLSNIGATTSLSPNTGMYAQLCYANPAGTDIEGCSLPIRPGGTPVPLTFTNSAAAVGQLTVVGGSTGQTVTATIGVGESITPQSGTGQVQFDPLGAGTTTVNVTSAGVISGVSATRAIPVSAPAITFLSTYITGAGLRLLNGNTRVTLGAPAPTGGLELTVSSSNGSVAGVAMNATSPGSGSIPGTVLSATSATVTIPAGQTIAYVAMDGMEGNPGTVTLTASAPGYTSGTAPLVVRPLALNLSNIGATTSLSPNTGMYAQLCYANPAGTDIEGCSLPIRPGGTPVPLTFTNSAAAVGQLTVVGGSTGQTVTATIGVGESITPQSGTGQVQFDPLGAGTTTVNVTSAGVISGVSATRAIPVSAPAITFLSTYITGAGLRLFNGNTRVTLGAPAPTGGLELTVSSSNGSVAGVAMNAANPGSGTIPGTVLSATSATVTIPAGQTIAYVAMDGMEGQAGTVTLTASAPGFTSGTAPLVVRPLALNLSNIGATTNLSPNTGMYAQLCYANPAGTDIEGCSLPIRPGGTPVPLTFTNSAAAVGQLTVVGGSTGQTVTATIGVGESITPQSGTGQVQFDPLGAGTTTVNVTSAGVISGVSATRAIPVSAPAITFLSTYITGAGLRLLNGNTRVTLGAPAPTGGLELTVSSSNGSVAGVAMNAANPGSGTIPGTVVAATSVTVTIPAGQSIAYVAMDGMEGQAGTVTLTASAPGFTSGTAPLVVRPLALNLSNIGSTTSAAVNTGMYAQLCYSNPAGTDIEGCSLPIRPGGAPMTLTFTNSAAAVGQLAVLGGSTGQTVTATIGVGESITPQSGTGQVQFDPLGTGTTTVNVARLGIISGASATRSIIVNP